jgi:hypothetical protein
MGISELVVGLVLLRSFGLGVDVKRSFYFNVSDGSFP